MCVLIHFFSMSSIFVQVTNSRRVLVVVKMLYILSQSNEISIALL